MTRAWIASNVDRRRN